MSDKLVLQLKVASIVGARPNFIKLVALAPHLERDDHIIIHTGQHYDYELSKIFFKELSIPEPNYFLGVGSGSHGYQVGEMIRRIEEALLKENPDIVIVYGDTNTTLAGAIAAKKAGFLLAHVESGYRIFNLTMQEEINRRLTDHISNILFAPTPMTAENLRNENVLGKIYVVGDVHVDVLFRFLSIIKKTKAVEKMGLEPRSYCLLTVHRAENTDDRSRLVSIMRAIIDVGDTIVFPIHPRTKKALTAINFFNTLKESDNVILTPPLGYIEFINLLMNSKKVITDSGGVQREAYVLGIPCITLREKTEMVELVDLGWNVLVGANYDKIIHAIKEFEPRGSRPSIFGEGFTGKKIVDIIREELEAAKKIN